MQTPSSALKSVIALVALLSIVERVNAQEFTYSVDLSAPVLLNSRLANGSLSNATIDSFTLVGSDGTFYYPNTTATVTINNALSAADSFVAANPLTTPVTYIGETYFSPGTLTVGPWMDQSALAYLTTINPNLATQILNSTGVMEFGFAYYKVGFSYDYSFATNDIEGDFASGLGIGILSSPVYGHTEGNWINASTQNIPLPFLGLQNTGFGQSATSWQIRSLDNLGGAGALTISNLSITVTPAVGTFYVSSVPEPHGYMLALLGFALISILGSRHPSPHPIFACPPSARRLWARIGGRRVLRT